MKKIRRIVVVLLASIAAFAFVPAALAHPLGNFTINHFAGLHITPELILVDYVLDMAEIPAFQEILTFDSGQNGQPDPSEAAAYHPVKCNDLRAGLDLRVNGHSTPLVLVSSGIDFPPGAGGLPTLRLTCAFEARFSGQATAISFADRGFPERLGWREIVVSSTELSLQGNFLAASISNRLTNYPQDLLSTPLDEREVSFQVEGIPGSMQSNASSPASQSLAPKVDRNDAFTRLITLENLTLPTLLFALAVSFVWGAMHALTPGHGKAVVGSYLIGERGTARHALLLGLTTTITHTAGVFAMGMVTLLAAQFITPEQLFPWLSFLSGLLVAGIGMKLMYTRWREARRAGSVERSHDSPTYDVHPHDHHHESGHLHPHAHPHNDGHAHHHSEHRASPGEKHVHGHAHSHLPPEQVTWRSILALGISGGILPCPSALIVLLSAIALGRIGFGLLLVLAFSAGLAGVLSGIGLLFVYAGRLIEFTPKRRWVLRFLPVASALVISLAGLGITVRALDQIGLFRL